MLCWNSDLPLHFNSYLLGVDDILLQENWKLNNDESAELILVFDAPLFTSQLLYEVSITINFQDIKMTAFNILLNVQLLPEDVTENFITTQRILAGNREDLRSVLLSLNKYDFVLILSTSANRSLESSFLVDCSLSGINVSSKNKFFIANNLGMDGALLEVDGDDGLKTFVLLNIYCRCEDELVAVLHHLHRNIPNVIVPTPLYRDDLNQLDPVELLKKSLTNEIGHLRGHISDSEEFIVKLVDLEHETDVVATKTG